MPKLGILFNIEELGGGLYGHAAYKVFFKTMDTRKLPNCVLYDGDTRATLSGGQNSYCIAVEAPEAATLEVVRNKFSLSGAAGLAPAKERFMENDLVQAEPLVLSAQVGAGGELLNCKTGWVMEAWNEIRQKTSLLTLWTETDFKTLRKNETRNEFIKSGVGLLMVILGGGINAAISSSAGNFSCLGLVSYALVIFGMWLFIFRFIPTASSKIPFNKFLLLAQKEETWFKVVPCPHCQHSNRVNTGYVEYICQTCAESNCLRSTLKTTPPDILVNGAECHACKGRNVFAGKPAVFLCENCKKEVQIEAIPM